MDGPAGVEVYRGSDGPLVQALLPALKAAGLDVTQSTSGGIVTVALPADQVARGAAVLAAVSQLRGSATPRPLGSGTPWPRVWIGVLSLVPVLLMVVAAVVARMASGGTQVSEVWTLLPIPLAALWLGRSASRLKEPTTNAAGPVSLALLISGVSVMALTGSVPTAMRVGVLVLGGLAALAALLVGFVGVVRTSGSTARRFTSGTVDAGIVTALGVVLMGSSLIGGLAAAAGRTARSAEAPRPAAPVVNEEANFTLTPPPGWATLDAAKLNPDADAAFAHTRDGTQIVVMVMVEPGVHDTSTRDLADASMRMLRSNQAVQLHGDFSGPAPAEVGGEPGLRFDYDATVRKHELSYRKWNLSHRGYLVEIVAWGKRGSPLLERSDDVVKAFRFIDPSRTAPREEDEAASPPPRHASHQHGYRVELAPRWAEPSDALREQNREADFIGQCGENSWFMVIPFALDGADVTDQQLFRAMAGYFGVEERNINDRKPVIAGGRAGERLAVSDRWEDERVSLDVLVVRGRGAGYLIVEKRATDDPAAHFCPPAVDALRWVDDAPPVSGPGMMTPWLLSTIARDAADGGNWAQAYQLRLGSALLRPSPVAVKALAEAAIQTRRMPEAIARFAGPDASADRELARAWLLHASGKKAQAYRLWARVFRSGHQDDAWFTHYLDALERGGRRRDAIAAVRAARRRADSPVLLRWEARLHQRAGKPAAALALLTRALDAGERDPFSLATLMDVLGDLKRHQRALEVMERYTRQGVKPTAPVLLAAARAEVGLKRMAAAKQTLEQARRLAPDDEEVAELSAAVDGWLGQSSTATLTDPVPEVPIPDGLPSPPAPSADAEPDGAEYLRHVVAVSFVPGKELRRTIAFTVKVNDRRGVEAFSTLQFTISPRHESMYLNRLTVRDGSGAVVGQANPADCYLSDQASEELGTDRRTVFIPAPGLEPGFTIDAVVTFRDLEPPLEMSYERFFFASGTAMRQSALVLSGALDRVVVTEHNLGAMQRHEEAGLRWWSAAGLRPHRLEPFSPPAESVVPWVVVGPRTTTWESEARAYLDTIRGVVEPDAATTAFARKLTRGLDSDAARLAALARWVQTSITYKAIEFGRGARVPRPSAGVMANRYGDCKDHSVLLHKLLRAVGIPSRLALIRSHGPLDRAVPTLDQFDHMIVHLPGGQPEFVDLTDKEEAYTASSLWLAGQEALVLDEKPAFRTVPDLGAEPVSVVIEREIRVEDDAVVVDGTLRLPGHFASGLRSSLQPLPPAKRNELVTGMLEDGAAVSSVEVRNLEDQDRPLELRVSYRLAGAVSASGGARIVKIPVDWERSYALVAEVKDRTMPVRVRYPFTLSSRSRFILPAGQEIALPGNRKDSGDIASWELRADGATLTVEARYERRGGEAPLEAYQPFFVSSTAFMRALGDPLVIRPAVGQPPDH